MNTSVLNNLKLSGYFPGAVGKLTELHATYYHDHWGFDVSFETQVGRELSDFIAGFEPHRDGFWTARIAVEFAGAVAIDGRQAKEAGARLRWFVVNPPFQGSGIGRILFEEAVAFCKTAGYRGIYLWTFEGLDAARSLYESAGFRLTEEHHIDQWGKSIAEQRFDLPLTT